MSLLDRLAFWRTDSPGPIEEMAVPIGKLFEGRGDSFTNELTGLGGSNDLTSRAVVQRRRRISDDDLVSLYRHNGYVRSYVDRIPDQATRKGWRIVSRGSGEKDPDQEPIKQLEKDLATRVRFGDALRWARLFGTSMILVVNGDPDLDEPLDPKNPGEILNLIVMDRREFSARSYNTDLSSPHFRSVETWDVYPAVGGSGGLVSGTVHRSRCIVFEGAKIPPSELARECGVHDSVVEAPYDQFRNKSVLDDQMARLAHDARTRVLKLKGMVKQGLSDARDALMARAKLIAQTINLTGVMLLLEGEEYTSQVDSVQGWSALDDKARQALAGVTDTPQTILFGDAPSGLNSDGESGRNNHGDIVAAHQLKHLRPGLEFLAGLLMASIGNRSSWELEFLPLSEPSEADVASLRKTVAETDAIYVNQVGALSPEDITRSRFGIRGWQMDIAPVDAEEIARQSLIKAEENAALREAMAGNGEE